MPIVLSKQVRIRITVEGEDATFIFHPYSNPALKKGIRDLLENRYVSNPGGTGGRQMLYPARSEFFDSNCLDCENIVTENSEGDIVPLDASTPDDVHKHHGVGKWQDHISEAGMSEVASHFEDMSVKAQERVEGE